MASSIVLLRMTGVARRCGVRLVAARHWSSAVEGCGTRGEEKETGKAHTEQGQLSYRQRLRAIEVPKALTAKLLALQLCPPRGRRHDPNPKPFSGLPAGENVPEIFQSKPINKGQACTAEAFQEWGLPEVAIAGRSNVGKSTLLNKLVGRWGTAKVLNKPGVTQSVNFYSLAGQLGLVDLPGYGFAYASDDKKRLWADVMAQYLANRKNLMRVLLLLDARHGVKVPDQKFMDYLDSIGTRFQAVLTKADMVKTNDLARRVVQVEQELQEHPAAILPVMVVSRYSEASLNVLRKQLAFLSRRAR